MLDFTRHRAIVRTNTAWIDGGVYLEAVPDGPNQFKRGMVLVQRDWKTMYFLCERDGWEDHDYFDFAEKRMKELKINKP